MLPQEKKTKAIHRKTKIEKTKMLKGKIVTVGKKNIRTDTSLNKSNLEPNLKPE